MTPCWGKRCWRRRVPVALLSPAHPCPSRACLAGRCCGCAGRRRTSWRRSSSNSSCRWRGTSSSRSSCWLRWAWLAVPAVGSPVLLVLLFSAFLKAEACALVLLKRVSKQGCCLESFFPPDANSLGFFLFNFAKCSFPPPLLCLVKCHGLHSDFIFPQLYGADTGEASRARLSSGAFGHCKALGTHCWCMTRLAAVLAHAGSLFLPSAGLPGTGGPTDQRMLLVGMGFLHMC